MANNQPQQTPQPAQTPQQPKKGTNVALIIIIIVVFLLILGAGGGYYVYYRAKKAVQKATESLPTTTTPDTTEEERTLPSSDVAGSDITDVSRYPDSVRTEYYKGAQGTFIDIVYKAEANADDILNYYKKQLPEKGWELTASEENDLTFTKNTSQLAVSITSEGKTIAEYELSYYPGLTD